MKKVEIVCAGKIKESYLKDGIEEYSKRLSRFCDFSIFETADFAQNADPCEKESALMQKRLCSCGGFKILLDIEGELLSSVQLAKVMDKAYSSGFDRVSFIIGGSEGVNTEIKNSCDLPLSFGRITLPHQLMRLVLCEQIYRSFTITGGLPYHK